MTDETKLQQGLTNTLNAAGNLPAPQNTGGGLSYKTATTEERAEMDEVITKVTEALQTGDSKAITGIGGPQLKELADQSDKILQSMNPQVTLAFKEALGQLLDALKANSLAEIKKRLDGGAIATLKGLFRRGKPSNEDMKKKVTTFMTNVNESRKTIQETADRLVIQESEIEADFGRIDEMGRQLNSAAQQTRIIRAATAECISRIQTKQITVLDDIQAKAASGRADDMQALRVAQANWNNLRTVDGALLSATNVFDTQVMNLAFTQNLDLQNSLQTQNALSITVPMWKSQLTTLGLMMRAEDFAEMLQVVEEMNVQSVKQGEATFKRITDIAVENAGSGTAMMRQLVESENNMTTTMLGLTTRFGEKYQEQAEAKRALEIAGQAFRQASVITFSQPGGVMGGQTPAPKKPGGPS